MLTTNSVDLQYFYAMKLFRAIRWFDLIGDKYIPKYEARREEACSGFDLLLKDDFARKHRTTIDYFMNGTDKAPPWRLMFIRCITDKLTRQEAEEIIRLGIIYDGAQAGDRANEIFLT